MVRVREQAVGLPRLNPGTTTSSNQCIIIIAWRHCADTAVVDDTRYVGDIGKNIVGRKRLVGKMLKGLLLFQLMLV